MLTPEGGLSTDVEDGDSRLVDVGDELDRLTLPTDLPNDDLLVCARDESPRAAAPRRDATARLLGQLR